MFLRCTGIVTLLMLLASCLGCGRVVDHSAKKQVRTDSTHVGIHHGTKSSDAVIANLRSQIETQPQNDELRYQLANAYGDRGDMQSFFREMRIAASLAPSKSLYRWVLAINYQKQGNDLDALNNACIAARLGTKDAKNLVPRYNKLAADVLMEKGRYRQAEQTYERALAQLSAYAPEISPLGSNASRTDWGKFEDEVKHSLSLIRDKLATQRPTQAWIRKDMPWFLFGVADNAKSLAASKEYIARTAPGARSGKLGKLGGAGTHSLLALNYLTIGDAQDAVIESLAAIELDPKRAIDWQTLGAAYVRQNRLGDAANAFQKSCDLGDQDSCTLGQKMQESVRRFQRYRNTSARMRR